MVHDDPASSLLEAVGALLRQQPTTIGASTRSDAETGRVLSVDLEFAPDGHTRMLCRIIALDHGEGPELLARTFTGPTTEADEEADMWELEERERV